MIELANRSTRISGTPWAFRTRQWIVLIARETSSNIKRATGHQARVALLHTNNPELAEGESTGARKPSHGSHRLTLEFPFHDFAKRKVIRQTVVVPWPPRIDKSVEATGGTFHNERSQPTDSPISIAPRGHPLQTAVKSGLPTPQQDQGLTSSRHLSQLTSQCPSTWASA